MGLLDNLKAKLDPAKDKVSGLAQQHGDKIDHGLDKAAKAVDEKTKGKYSDKIQTGHAARPRTPWTDSRTGRTRTGDGRRAAGHPAAGLHRHRADGRGGRAPARRRPAAGARRSGRPSAVAGLRPPVRTAASASQTVRAASRPCRTAVALRPGGDHVPHAVRRVLVQQRAARGPRPRPRPRAPARGPGPAAFSSYASSSSSALSAATSAAAQRPRDLRVEAGRPLVEIAGRLERAAGAGVAHHQQRHPLGPGRDLPSDLDTPLGRERFPHAESFDGAADQPRALQQPGGDGERRRQRARSGRAGAASAPCTEPYVEVHAEPAEGAARALRSAGRGRSARRGRPPRGRSGRAAASTPSASVHAARAASSSGAAPAATSGTSSGGQGQTAAATSMTAAYAGGRDRAGGPTGRVPGRSGTEPSAEPRPSAEPSRGSVPPILTSSGRGPARRRPRPGPARQSQPQPLPVATGQRLGGADRRQAQHARRRASRPPRRCASPRRRPRACGARRRAAPSASRWCGAA